MDHSTETEQKVPPPVSAQLQISGIEKRDIIRPHVRKIGTAEER